MPFTQSGQSTVSSNNSRIKRVRKPGIDRASKRMKRSSNKDIRCKAS